MSLSLLKAPRGSKKAKKRIGRGAGSGHGKTSGKGHKGQKARSGGNIPRGFEGGQMPLLRRIPKRGFTNRFKEFYTLVNIKDLNKFGEKETVGPEYMKEKGIIKDIRCKVKVLGDGELSIPLTVRAHKFSDNAIKKIEGAGGKAEVL